MFRIHKRTLAVALVASVASSYAAQSANAAVPDILSSTASFESNSLTINGGNLGEGLAIVTLGSFPQMAVTQQTADRLVVMHAGRVVEEGPTETVLREPGTSSTLELLEAASFAALD